MLVTVPAALSASTVPPAGVELEEAIVPAIADVGPFDDETSPLYLVGRNDMWDPLGTGCIDPAEAAAWTPDGQRDPEAGVLCLARPCVRLLTTEEMEYPVLGRPLRDDEWDLYSARHAADCAETSVAGASGLDLLPGAAEGWAAAARPFGLALWSGPRGGSAPRGASTGGDGGSGPVFGDDGDGSAGDPRGGSSLRPDAKDDKAPPQDPRGDLTRPDPGQQPTPVPLPGSLAMLLTGLVALGARRR